ncbi:DUF559 domain-containing protein [Leucobacter sp. NPDC058333]|uniref:DUF559 domain-containing protein n=1 Tax=Leucobacter sp. NPDC058333 TaxID=3346450 RepID=UPI00365E7962
MSSTRIDGLRQFSEQAQGPGARRLRQVAKLARDGAESRMESLTRIVGYRVGIDDLELQLEVRDANGTWIGRFDLGDVAVKRIIEYDGEQHRTVRSQYLKDIRRLEAARDAGWRVMIVHREDVLHDYRGLAQRMLKFLDRVPRRPRPPLAKLLEERYPPSAPTESAIPQLKLADAPDSRSPSPRG